MCLAAIPIAAVLCAATASVQPASAFSQIGSETGSSTQRDGIVSVPLPPLSGEATGGTTGLDPAGPETPGAAAPGGEAPGAKGLEATDPVPVSPANTPAGAPAEPGGPDGPADADETQTQPSDQTAPSELPTRGIDPAKSDPAEPLPGAEDPLANGPAVASPNPPVAYGEEGLPRPVRDLRERLIAIARAGEIEALRPYIEIGEDATLLSFGGSEGDPIAFLKSASGDGEGLEVLAILLEVLQAGHVRNEPATENEIFVWPYFTALSIDQLTKPQKVELFELVTAGDYQEMIGFGAYNFYRVGISPDGKLQFFVAGD